MSATTTVTKSKVVSQIKTSNIISYTLLHEQLQENFQLIVEALSFNQNETEGLKYASQKITSRLTQIQRELQLQKNKLKEQSSKTDILNEKLNNLTDAFGNMNIKFEGLQRDHNQQKEINKARNARLNPQERFRVDERDSNQAQKTVENLKKITSAHDEILRRLQQRVGINETKTFNNQQAMAKDIESLRKQIISIGKASDADRIWTSINELKERMGQYCLKDELQRISVQIKAHEDGNNRKFQSIDKEIQVLRSCFDDDKRLRLKTSHEVWKLNEIVFKIEAQQLDGNTISPKMFTDMEKDIMEVKQKVNMFFRDTGKEVSTGYNRSLNSLSRLQNTETRISEDASPSKQLAESVDLKNQMMKKMKQQRTEILKVIKKSDSSAQDAEKNKLLAMEEAFKRMEHILMGKADIDSTKKLVAYLENKINYVFQIISATNEEDALIAKKNWFCLSCDKKLDTYRGRVGPFFSANNQPKGETNKHEVIGGGMSMRAKSKVDLPKMASK